MEILKDIADLQSGWDSLKSSKTMTKKDVCNLCIPFRDKYELTDKQTLMIARQELSLTEIYNLMKEKYGEKFVEECSAAMDMWNEAKNK